MLNMDDGEFTIEISPNGLLGYLHLQYPCKCGDEDNGICFWWKHENGERSAKCVITKEQLWQLMFFLDRVSEDVLNRFDDELDNDEHPFK